jgi:hypothetical protein
MGADAGERAGGDADVQQAFEAVEPVQGGAAGGVEAAFLVEQAAQELRVDVGHDAASLGSGRAVAVAVGVLPVRSRPALARPRGGRRPRAVVHTSRSHAGVTAPPAGPIGPARGIRGQVVRELSRNCP